MKAVVKLITLSCCLIMCRVHSFTLTGYKFHSSPITWSIETTVGDVLDETGVIKMTRLAIDQWATTGLKFKFTSDYRNAMIKVSFKRGDHGDGSPFDGPGLIVAHAFLPGVVMSGQVHLDADETFKTLDGYSIREPGVLASKDATCLYATLLHEIGHAIGLEHSSKRNSVMYKFYNSNEPNRRLSDDDRNAVQQLYFTHLKHFAPVDVPTSIANASGSVVRKNRSNGSNSTRRNDDRARGRKKYYDTCYKILPSTPSIVRFKREALESFCSGVVDFIGVLRNELYVFVAGFHWRFRDTYGRVLHDNYPMLTGAVWKLPIWGRYRVVSLFETPDTKMFVIGVTAPYEPNTIIFHYIRFEDMTVNKTMRMVSSRHSDRVFVVNDELYRIHRASSRRDISSVSKLDFSTLHSLGEYTTVAPAIRHLNVHNNILTVMDHTQSGAVLVFYTNGTYQELGESNVKSVRDTWTRCRRTVRYKSNSKY